MTIHQSVTAEGVLELVMDNPKVNALPIDDTQAIAELLDGVKHRPEITAVILTATGRGFCAGVDIKEMQSMPGHEGILGVNRACAEAFRAVYECAVPVVCAVNDFCLGTGIGLAGSADIVLAAEGVKFGLPEVDNGALGAATHLGRLVPEKHLRWMLYSCEPVSAEQLREWGTVLDVVPAGELMDRPRDRRCDRLEVRPGDPSGQGITARHRSRPDELVSLRAGIHLRTQPAGSRRRSP